MSSAYFHTVLRELAAKTRKELAAQGIDYKLGRKELERVNRELKKEVLGK